MPIKVPTLPNDPKISGWRRLVTSVVVDLHGLEALNGTRLEAGDVVAVPPGALILAVDKFTTGWDYHFRTGKPYPVQDATVTVYLASDDTLTELWTRHFKKAASALGATTLKKLTALLEKYPEQPGVFEIIEEARRPNRKAGNCRWCGRNVSAHNGHLRGHGDDTEVEHWQDCPTRTAEAGAPCTLCGVTVAQDQAQEYLVREWPIRWETRHRPHLNCTQRVLPSYEEQLAALQEARAAQQRGAEKKRQREATNEARRIKREQNRRAAVAEETARVAGLTVTKRTTTELWSKNLGGGVRGRLLEHADELSDGTTTTRWAVVTVVNDSGYNGEDYDPVPDQTVIETLDKPIASATYKALKWTPTPRLLDDTSGGTCEECHQRAARHTRNDSSGIQGRVCDRCNEEEDYMLSFA
ncbi:hypothetical protein [Streptosporangium sp. NPDC002524]|uniref:hypothetical protein n=1 Tax=Streptosporangium sp. NPDC002524 TaxID=3154537 RepID=UPI00332FCF93